MSDARRTLDLAVSERQFQQSVIDAARALGWRVYHTHDARHSAAGFPDLICLRAGRGLALELKTMRGRASAEQVVWLDAFAGTVFRSGLYRPCDWDALLDAISEVLR